MARAKSTQKYGLLYGLSLLAGFVAFFVPAAYLLTDIIEATNEVHITALVPGPEDEVEEPAPSVITGDSNGGGGGGASGSNDTSTEEDSETDEDVDEDDVWTLPQDFDPEETGDNPSTVTDDTDESLPPVEETAQATIHFGGYSFPNAIITFTLNGEIIDTLTADSSGYFEGVYANVDLGSNVFSFQSEDLVGNESHLVSYSYTVQNATPVYISSILLPPIFEVNNSGELGGTAIPGATITVYGLNQSDQNLEAVGTATVNNDGTYSYNFDLSKDVVYEQYYVSCEYSGADCGFSSIIQVQTVGDSNKFVEQVFADFSNDVEVNFVDFAFIRAAFLSQRNNLIYDLNMDGEIDLVDFSLLNYQWSL